MSLFSSPCSSQQIVVHDGLMFHVYFWQHGNLLLFPLLLPGCTLVSTVKDTFCLYAVFIEFAIAVGTHCTHKQGQCLFFLSQLYLQTFVLLLHLNHFLGYLIVFCTLHVIVGMYYTSKDGLLIGQCASPFFSHHNGGRIVAVCCLATVLYLLLTILDTLQSLFTFSCFLFRLSSFAVWIGLVIKVQKRNVTNICYTLLADGQNTILLLLLLPPYRLCKFQRHHREKGDICIMEKRRLGLASFGFVERDTLLATLALEFCRVCLVRLVSKFHIGGLHVRFVS